MNKNTTLTKLKDLNLLPQEVRDMPDPKKMSKKELVKFAQDFMIPLSDPERYKEIVRSSMPDLIKTMDDKEVMAEAMMQSSQEMMLAVVETLKKYHNFSDTEITKFNRNLVANLTIVEKIEEAGLSILSPHSMGVIADQVEKLGVDQLLRKIAETRYAKESAWKEGKEFPNLLQGSKIEQQIEKPRKKKE